MIKVSIIKLTRKRTKIKMKSFSTETYTFVLHQVQVDKREQKQKKEFVSYTLYRTLHWELSIGRYYL